MRPNFCFSECAGLVTFAIRNPGRRIAERFRGPAAMKFLFSCLFSSALLLSCRPTDPISRAVDRESSSRGGLYKPIKLPSTASEAEVVTKALSRPVKILTNREVRINDVPYRAVLVDTSSGSKVVLIRYDENVGWWSSVYED